MSEIGVAVLGLGRAGSFHLTSIGALPGVRLETVFDIDGERIEHRLGFRRGRHRSAGCRSIRSSDLSATSKQLSNRHGLIRLGLNGFDVPR